MGNLKTISFSGDENIDVITDEIIQGASMGLTAFQHKGTMLKNANLNNLEVGIYVLDSFVNVDMPNSSGFYGVFIQFGGRFRPQVIFGGTDGKNSVYSRRYYTSVATFSDWIEVYNPTIKNNGTITYSTGFEDWDGKTSLRQRDDIVSGTIAFKVTNTGSVIGTMSIPPKKQCYSMVTKYLDTGLGGSFLINIRSDGTIRTINSINLPVGYYVGNITYEI